LYVVLHHRAYGTRRTTMLSRCGFAREAGGEEGEAAGEEG
jgi:hypothetical protein